MSLEELSPHWPYLNEKGIPVPDHYLVKGHAPKDCPSAGHISYINSSSVDKEKFYDAGLGENTYPWCPNCIVPKRIK